MINKNTLVIKDLNKSFGEIPILENITAFLPPATVTAFIGPNGAGKTTLFHAITGDLVPDSGSVILQDYDITGKPPWKVARQGLGKMFQDVRVFDNLTVTENIMLALHDHSGQSAWASLTNTLLRRNIKINLAKKAKTWLDKTGVKGSYDKPAKELSFGNKKLLAMARLMAGKFDLLLLDEPTAGVSLNNVKVMIKLIKDLTKQGVTIAVIEHNFDFVTKVAERTYLLQDGKICDDGPTEKVLGNKSNREILIGL